MSAVFADEAAAHTVVALAEVVDFNPKPARGSLTDDLEVSFVPMASVEAESGRLDPSQVRTFGEVKKGFTHFRDGDVLFAKITPCMDNGKMAVASGLRNGIGYGSTEFHVLRPRRGLEAKYLYYFVSAAGFRREAAHHMTGAVGQKRVPLSFLEQSQIPLPAVAKQQRIVAEIEKQFSRLDEAVANLQRVKANLKRHRAAVLRDAVVGALVRSESGLQKGLESKFESGTELLRRCLRERKKCWRGPGNYREPEGPVTSDLPTLPAGWVWASAVQVCDRVVDCHNKTAPYVEQGIPLVRTTNIRDGRIVESDMRFVDQSTYDFWSRRCPPQPGDVLFTREAPMGEAAIVPDGMKVCLGQRTMLMRPSSAIDKRYLLASLISPVVKKLIDQLAVGSGVKHLRVGDVERIPIPLPPVAEQRRIVSEVDRRLSIVREVESQVDANLKRAQALRQAVLAKAFTAHP